VREVSMTFPPDYEKEALRGKTGITRITIGQAYRLVPPTQAELFKLLNVTDEAALKVLVREKLAEAKTVQEHGRIENVILEKLVTSHTFDVPQMMVDEQTNARLGQLKQQMTQQGASARGVRTLFLMQAIAEKENLLVTREDMQAEVQLIAERNNAKVEEVVKYYQEKNLFDQMAVELLERKVRKFLRESAQIKEPS
jgi:trigger factor